MSDKLTREEMEEIAEIAAEKAVKLLADTAYKAVGKSIIEKLFWIVGVLTVGVYLWMKEKGLVT